MEKLEDRNWAGGREGVEDLERAERGRRGGQGRDKKLLTSGYLSPGGCPILLFKPATLRELLLKLQRERTPHGAILFTHTQEQEVSDRTEMDRKGREGEETEERAWS